MEWYFEDPNRPDEGLLKLWHENRTPVLLFTFVVLVVVRILLHTKGEKHELLALPKVYGQVQPSVTDAKDEGDSDAKPKSVGPVGSSKTAGPRRIKGDLSRRGRAEQTGEDGDRQIQILVFFSSLSGNTERIAKEYIATLETSLKTSGEEATPSIFLTPHALDLAEVDYDEYFVAPPKASGPDGAPLHYFYLFLIPSYNIDTINDTFLEHLKETHHDFRIDTGPLSALLGYSVFGYGDRVGWPTEDKGFCFQAKEVDKWMAKLTSRKRAFPLGVADDRVDGAKRLEEWNSGVVEILGQLAETKSLGEGVPGSGDAAESDDEFDADMDDGEVFIEDSATEDLSSLKKPGRVDDVEDLGRLMSDSRTEVKSSTAVPPLAVDFTTSGKPGRRKAPPAPVKEMVPKGSPTYASLTKQGYSIVGSHSGVKICRWTKSALRGRGSCYKFSFYGINSHQCMETTPSLSCSNKCVFCWRHGTNPVGTNWRWVVDPPDLIFNGVKENHYKKIKMLRAVPGVRAERFAEAMRIRRNSGQPHPELFKGTLLTLWDADCALSLVGEPIFYPHINEFLEMLHGERISSFLVCNAQHPDQLAALKHVTQLYVSIDASNKDSLRRIDRPLHRDFWERFQRCLDILRERRFRQRTVYRLTLVKGFNVEDEAEGYADLIERGLPCFVEIKGVTYCGTSTSSGAGLTMANVPFYHEVCDFVVALEKALRARGLEYGIAAEHAHSCCILLASERFRVDGKWHTLIDYDRFFELLEEKGPDGDFSPEDYMGPETPEWATWGNGGFDPRDQRVDRKGRPIAAS